MLFPRAFAGIAWVFEPDHRRSRGDPFLEVEHFFAEDHIGTPVAVDIRDGDSGGSKTLTDQMRLESSVAAILEPPRAGNEIELSIAIHIAEDELFAIGNVGEHAGFPGLGRVAGYFPDRRAGAFAGVVPAGDHCEFAAGKERRDKRAVRPVAVAGADGIFFPFPRGGVDRFEPDQLIIELLVGGLLIQTALCFGPRLDADEFRFAVTIDVVGKNRLADAGDFESLAAVEAIPPVAGDDFLFAVAVDIGGEDIGAKMRLVAV